MRISTIRYISWMITSTAGAMLREARSQAGLSQVQLAQRAGVTQSVISAYEAGHRQPAMATLRALIDAAGYDLVVSIRRQPRRLATLSGPVGRRVRYHRDDLIKVADAHGLKNLMLFGSCARGDDQIGSDVDLLAEFPSSIGLFGFGRIQSELEAIVEAPVDLVPADGLKPGIRSRIEPDLVPL